MPTISKDNKVATLINVFTVEPGNQQKVVDMLVQTTEKAMKHIPGFVSASIHKSLDGTRVTNYAQAADHAAWERIVARLQGDGFFEQFQKLSKPNPCLYRCTFSLCAE